jgi:hypothetical protein
MKIKGLLGMGLILGLTGMMSGCGSDNSTPAASGPGGTALQGPVSGATVVAKKVGNSDFSKIEKYDATNDELSVKTGTDGKFKFQSNPPYAHTLVMLTDGIDTLTGQKNIQMIAKAGSTYITPLTTLVATDTTGNVEAKLLALLPPNTKITNIGDLDTSTQATPALLIVSKTIETAVTAMSATVSGKVNADGTNANKISPQQLAAVQTQTLQAIATTIAALPVDTATATLQTPSSLNTVVMAPALNVAITEITKPIIINNVSTPSNITISNPTAIATTIATAAIVSSANSINGTPTLTAPATAANTSTVLVVESDKININASAGSAAATAAATVTTQTAAAVTTASAPANITVVATPPAYVPPVVPTALAPAVISANLVIPSTGPATITIKFNHAINFNGTGSVMIGTANVAGTEALTAPDTITFTATNALPADSTLTVTVSGNTANLTAAESLKNFSAAMPTTTFTITVPTVPTGATGGSSSNNI